MSRRLGANGNGAALAFRPAVDIYEDDGSITLSVELPGMKAEEIHVDLQDNVLTLSGERKLERSDEREGYHRVERSYGSFSRSFSLPENVDGEKCDAEMTDGVLRVKLPKRPQPEPKKIEVKAK
jgi:HSP20 family protein